MKAKLKSDLSHGSLFAVKELDELTLFEGNLLERTARRSRTGVGVFGHGRKLSLFLVELTLPQLMAKGTLFLPLPCRV